jgi:hypothetical protein
MTASGKQAYQQKLAAAAVGKWPGRTSLELSKVSGQCRWMLARRLPEIEEQGIVYRGPTRRCEGSGRRAATWFPVEPNQQLALIA